MEEIASYMEGILFCAVQILQLSLPTHFLSLFRSCTEVILLIWLLLQSLCLCTINNGTLSSPCSPTHAFEQLWLLG